MGQRGIRAPGAGAPHSIEQQFVSDPHLSVTVQVLRTSLRTLRTSGSSSCPELLSMYLFTVSQDSYPGASGMLVATLRMEGSQHSFSLSLETPYYLCGRLYFTKMAETISFTTCTLLHLCHSPIKQQSLCPFPLNLVDLLTASTNRMTLCDI